MGAKLAGGGGGKGMQPNSEPNVIPFIDIMLVLLIIFMVASPPPTVDIKVDIPPNVPSKKTDSIDKPTFVIQNFNAPGDLSYQIGDDKAQLRLDQLGAKLRDAAYANNPSLQSDPKRLFLEGKIIVRAHNEAEYNSVIAMMEAIDQAGFKAVSLSIQPPEEGS